MSFTLPYASAINCEFVNSPDFMVTSDNLLKLYSINGGGGGGGDSYTKAESDARYLQLITAANQTITQTPQFANKLTIAHGTGKLTLDTGQSAGSDRNIVIPNSGSDCEILITKPSVAQIIQSVIIGSYRPTGNLYIQSNGALASVRNYYFDTQSTKYTNSSQYIITGESRDIANFETWKPNPFFTMTSSHTANPARNITVPALSADSQVIVTNAATEQIISGIKIRSYTTNNDYIFTNGENVLSGTSWTIPSSLAVKNYVDTASTAAIPKTDIVTTVTGASDTKVPSEKAVKTYVDGHLSSGSVQSLTSLVWSTSNWGTYLTLPVEMFNVEGYHKIALKIINNVGNVHYGVFAVAGFPEYTSIRVQITGFSTLNTGLSPEYQTVNAIFSKTVTTEESPYGSGSANGTYFNNWVNGGDVVYAERDQVNHGIRFAFDSHAANRIGTYTIETWVSFLV